MSGIDRRIASLGRHLGSVVAATKLRVTEWGPTIQIRIHESVGGRINGQRGRLLENVAKQKQKIKRLFALMERKRLSRKIGHYIAAKYPNRPEVIQTASAILQDRGPVNLIRVLANANRNSLVVGSPGFDEKLFSLLSQVGDRLVIGDRVYQKEWASVVTGEPIAAREGNGMGTMTIQAAVKRLAKLKAQKRLIEFLNVPLMAQGNRSQVDKEPIQTGNDIYYKNGGDELIEDLLQIFYDEILNAPSSDYVQKKRDPSQFPPKKKDPAHF